MCQYLLLTSGARRKIQPNQTQEDLGGGAETCAEKVMHTPGVGKEEAKIAGDFASLMTCVCSYLERFQAHWENLPSSIHSPNSAIGACNATIRVSSLGVRPPFILVEMSTSAKGGRVGVGERALGSSQRWEGERRGY